MMVKFFEAVRKEWLMLMRDLPGLAILFLMPLLLILVVTLAQERALKNQVERTSVVVSAPPESLLGRQIRQDLTTSGMFLLTSDSLSPDAVSTAVANGKVPVGIIVAQEDTSITLCIDPTLNQSYSSGVVATARFIIKGSQGKLLMQSMMQNALPSGVVINPDEIFSGLPPVRSTYAVRERSTIKPTPVQNNVPGFILFAMFFIVIPLSGSIIAEKNEGPYLRLQTLPVSIGILLGAKVFLFLIVCILQFLLMLGTSFFLFHHLFGFPPLAIGSSISALIVTTITAALAAVGFGLLVGAFSRTHAQAALFGSVLVVLLGIISGTFLPIHVMPESIQWISRFSPVRWGIDNYLELFIRDGTVADVLPRAFLLLLFFIFAMLFSIPIFAKKN